MEWLESEVIRQRRASMSDLVRHLLWEAKDAHVKQSC